MEIYNTSMKLDPGTESMLTVYLEVCNPNSISTDTSNIQIGMSVQETISGANNSSECQRNTLALSQRCIQLEVKFRQVFFNKA